jgi:hypothetical protein
MNFYFSAMVTFFSVHFLSFSGCKGNMNTCGTAI